jgi:hypothetical protein
LAQIASVKKFKPRVPPEFVSGASNCIPKFDTPVKSAGKEGNSETSVALGLRPKVLTMEYEAPGNGLPDMVPAVVVIDTSE